MLVFICSLCVSRSPLPSARCLSKSKSSATRNILKRNGQHDHIASKCGQFWRNLVILVNSGDSDEASAIEYAQRWIAGEALFVRTHLRAGRSRPLIKESNVRQAGRRIFFQNAAYRGSLGKLFNRGSIFVTGKAP